MRLEDFVHKYLKIALCSPYCCMSDTNIWFFPTSLIINNLWKKKVTTNIAKYGLQTYVKYWIWNDKYFLSLFFSLWSHTHSIYPVFAQGLNKILLKQSLYQVGLTFWHDFLLILWWYLLILFCEYEIQRETVNSVKLANEKNVAFSAAITNVQ